MLESGYYDTPLGYNNADWYRDEIIKIEKKMAFYFKNTSKKTILTQEDWEEFINNKICRFCEKEVLIKFETTVTQQVIIEDRLLAFVVLISHRNKIIL